MTESVAYFLVIRLLNDVREEVEFVRDELERMTTFLRMADVMEQRNAQVQVLVKQVRDVAFDMEDILDEFKHHLVQDERKGFLSKVNGIMKINYGHRIASQIRQIKSRIVNISEGHKRYKDVLDHQSKSYVIVREHRGDAVLVEEDELVGIDNPKSQLLDWLLDEPAFKVISVVGMGGLGKTTLVKNVYESDAVKRHFKNPAWITVSKSFEIEQLLKDLISQLFNEAMQSVPQSFRTMKSQALKEIVKLFFKESRSLIVLDDLWDTEAWEAIKYAFPQGQNGNRLMLTTRNNEVANVACAEFKGEVFCLEPLSFEMSWKLLCNKTFQGRECPSHLVSITQTILERCKGLPLAIVVISGVLVRKKQGNADEWEKVNRNLGNMLQENKLLSISSILLLIYYDLPLYLLSCLLYMGMVSEDYEIEEYRLSGLWIAEGFVEQKDGMTKYEVAEDYLMELKARSLIQVVVNVKAWGEVCSIHDLLRELLLFKSKDHKFATTVNEKNRRWHERIRRLSIHNTLGKIHDEKQISGLRSLLTFGAPNFSIKSFGNGLRMLRVLDLEGTKNLDVFPKEITNFYHLRLLSLNDTNVREIPSSNGKLQNLEIFLLKGTQVNRESAEPNKTVCGSNQ